MYSNLNLDSSSFYTLKEVYRLFRSTLSRGIRSLALSLLSDDIRYAIYFSNILASKMYNLISSSNSNFCVFCKHLLRSPYHKHRFICSKKTYKGHDPLLPGIYPFCINNPDSDEESYIPWLFKSSCDYFQCLDAQNYLKNFKSLNISITIANYETLEGLFYGLCRGRRPCHICASVDVNIYKNCPDAEESPEDKPCSSTLYHMFQKFTV